jgi:hypothetical protein
MFAGHVGVGLALARAERRLNVAIFVTAALALDFLVWVFILLGWENVQIPPDFAVTRQMHFMFPYSHGLGAALLWSVVAGAVALYAVVRLEEQAKPRAAALIAAAVFSHWLLDAAVHRPELPLLGGGSALVGLGLWSTMPLALLFEGAILVLGLWLFVSGSALPRARVLALVALSLLILAFTVVGMTLAPPPPSVFALAISSLVTLALVAGLYAWIGKLPEPRLHST